MHPLSTVEVINNNAKTSDRWVPGSQDDKSYTHEATSAFNFVAAKYILINVFDFSAH
jgi:hypothetical protein